MIDPGERSMFVDAEEYDVPASEETDEETGEVEAIDMTPPFVSENGRLSITMKTTFSHAGNSHWAGVELSDEPMVFLDDDGNALVEDSDMCVYRVSETVRRLLAASVAAMKRDIDERRAGTA